MNAPDYREIGHLNPLLSDETSKTLDPTKLCGRWVNANRDTFGITECTVEKGEDHHFNLSIVAAGNDERISWPTVTAQTLANLEEESGQRAYALSATFNHGFMTSEIYIRVNKGVLVIVLFNSFRDDSGRSDYVTREFFYRQD